MEATQFEADKDENSVVVELGITVRGRGRNFDGVESGRKSSFEALYRLNRREITILQYC